MGAANTEIIVRAVVRRDGWLLLARRRGKSWSFLPGGHVEPGERVEAALVREIAEELGADAAVAGFLGAVEYGYAEDDATHHELNLVFEVELDDTAPASREEHLEFHRLPLDHPARESALRISHAWPPCGAGASVQVSLPRQAVGLSRPHAATA